MSVRFFKDDLRDLREDLKRGFNTLKKKAEANPECAELQDFFKRRKEDYEVFLDMCLPYTPDNYINRISEALRKRGKEAKFYGGMCQKGAEYFDVTQKVQKAISSMQISFEDLNQQPESKQRIIDCDFDIPDELTGEEAEEFAEMYLAKYGSL